MRIGLHALAGRASLGTLLAYPYPRDSFTLVSGKQVTDPATQQPAAGDCDPYQCGVPAAPEISQWCSFWGAGGSLDGCNDPQCAPYVGMIAACSLPQVPSSAAAAAVNAIPTLTPENIVAPLPDITRVLQPQPVYADCSTWNKLNGAIADNPFVSILVLAGFAFAVFSHHKKAGRRAA